ncbi:cysteine desulfurase-like protein [Rhizobium leguminosarum]|uniref:Cysteine desulfurase-like protein n=1 Tax=Rhizobium leguminosarum TaxID=384 RepID=A0A1B1CKD7_RHILE|nr:cysteine desulfurase-like protein [Rhizobium leguminosarum]ANP90214.1 cysteine desulfurase-like protein [Rhizobium leguminosarum]
MLFPIDAVRANFAALNSDQSTIYLDNPAGTLVPKCVIDAVATAMATASNNLGGFFRASLRADDVVNTAHSTAAQMLGAASADEIIIGANMTSLTFHLSRSIGLLMKAGDEIILTRMDHEGDVAPWLMMARDHDLVVKWLDVNRDSWRLEADDLALLLSERTAFVALNFASNVTGSINDIAVLVKCAKSVGALVYVDAVQYVPHRLPDVAALNCDFLACSSYKFYGPHLGIVWGRLDLLERMEAYKCRSVPNVLPIKFETGTPQTELQAGLTATGSYLASLGSEGSTLRERMLSGYAAFNAYEDDLTRRLIDGLKSFRGVTIHGIANLNEIEHRVPTVSFTHDRVSSHDIARELANKDICIWSGNNYALGLMQHIGLDEQEGVVRFGIAHYNTAAEIDQALAAVDRVLR